MTVAVIGDFILDKYVLGTVSRISPEGPIPVLLGRNSVAVLGGAGNVVANIVSLGANAVPIGLLGQHEVSDRICEILGEMEVDTAGLARTPGRTVPVKTRFIGGKQQILRLDEEEFQSPSPEERDWLTRAAETVQCDIAVLSDYGKGTLWDGAAEALIATFRARGIPVLVDPKGADYSRYRGATAVSPNLKELREVSNRALDSDFKIADAGRALIAAHQLDFLLVTRGEDGLSAVLPDRDFHMPTRAKEVFDVSGAGDTLISAFAVALAAGLSLEDACHIANAAAGVVVAKTGTATVSLPELERSLGQDLEDRHGAVLPVEIARLIVDRWRADKLEVGFTNGCFDILHPGHIALFEQASEHCDKLIVGLNSDASVTRLKGPSRPILDQASRARILAALGMVDMVVIFDEDTPYELIGELGPDVLVKGSDYAEDEIVGADLVKASGGRVVRATLVDGMATSTIVRRIGKTHGGPDHE